VEEVDGITVYLAPGLGLKHGHNRILIVLKRFLFLAWLELEGAKAIPVYDSP